MSRNTYSRVQEPQRTLSARQTPSALRKTHMRVSHGASRTLSRSPFPSRQTLPSTATARLIEDPYNGPCRLVSTAVTSCVWAWADPIVAFSLVGSPRDRGLAGLHITGIHVLQVRRA
eukprot:scaffold2093_cov425-Prasinococcus_capsulatus_cf.AAC.16